MKLLVFHVLRSESGYGFREYIFRKEDSASEVKLKISHDCFIKGNSSEQKN